MKEVHFYITTVLWHHHGSINYWCPLTTTFLTTQCQNGTNRNVVCSLAFARPQNLPEPTVHWNRARSGWVVNWEAKFRHINSRIDRIWHVRKRQSSRAISIKNLHSFWILEWSEGKHMYTTPVGWLLTTIENKQKIDEISFSWVMTGYWFHHWRIRTHRQQWPWKILCITSKLRLVWAVRPIWWMGCFDLILGMWPDLT